MAITHSNTLPKSMYRPKYHDSPFIHIADLVNEQTGKTYREENAEKTHSYPVGSLVEIVSDYDDYPDDEEGVRLFVVSHDRDCDMTPLYSLAVDVNDTTVERIGFRNRRWHSGYPEWGLKLIRPPANYASTPTKTAAQ